MNFKIIDNGKEIVCDIVLTFSDQNNNIDYIVYTDGTKDENGELEIYASRYKVNNNDYELLPIEQEYEWDLIDNMLESKYKELDR